MTDQRDGEVSLEQYMDDHAESHAEDLHAAAIGRVESYDANAQVCDVQPMVRRAIARADGTIAREQYPVLRAVPVLWFSAGGWFVHFPLEAGTTVLLVVLDRDPAAWRQTGALSSPLDTRVHHLSHAVAIPGLRHRRNALSGLPADAMVVGRQGGPIITITETDIQIAGTDALTIASKLDVHLDAIAADITTIAAAATVPVTTYGTTERNIMKTASPIAATKVKGV